VLQHNCLLVPLYTQTYINVSSPPPPRHTTHTVHWNAHTHTHVCIYTTRSSIFNSGSMKGKIFTFGVKIKNRDV